MLSENPTCEDCLNNDHKMRKYCLPLRFGANICDNFEYDLENIRKVCQNEKEGEYKNKYCVTFTFCDIEEFVVTARNQDEAEELANKLFSNLCKLDIVDIDTDIAVVRNLDFEYWEERANMKEKEAIQKMHEKILRHNKTIPEFVFRRE